MRLTAFEPPPPTPTTTIRAVPSFSPFTAPPCPGPAVVYTIAVQEKEYHLGKEAAQPVSHLCIDAISRQSAELSGLGQTPFEQAHARGKGRIADRLDQRKHPCWRADPCRCTEYLAGQPPDSLK